MNQALRDKLTAQFAQDNQTIVLQQTKGLVYFISAQEKISIKEILLELALEVDQRTHYKKIVEGLRKSLFNHLSYSEIMPIAERALNTMIYEICFDIP